MLGSRSVQVDYMQAMDAMRFKHLGHFHRILVVNLF
jgi:hypothetical protein